MQRVTVLLQQLHGYRTLAGDNLGVIIRVDENHVALFSQLQRMRIGFVIGITVQQGFATQGLYRLDLDSRGGARHHDERLEFTVLCCA